MPLIADADYYVMESNHDVGMFMQTRRPYPIKMRILSDSGHLCNEDCAHLLTRLVTPRTRSIFLAHLSEEANQPQLAWQVSADALKQCACRKDLVLKAAAKVKYSWEDADMKKGLILLTALLACWKT